MCSRSTVLRKAIEFPGKEAEEAKIDLSDNDATMVKLLMQYLYEADYEPALPSFEASPPLDAQTASHTCNTGFSNCRSHMPSRNVCCHHKCGHQCSYDCNNFVCDKCFTLEGDAGQLLVHAKLYQMADKYDVVGLKDLCIEKYKSACLKFWNDPEFAESAHHVYCTSSTRDKGLRSVVCQTISDHMELLKKPEVEDLMTEYNGLAFGLLFDKAEKAGWCQ